MQQQADRAAQPPRTPEADLQLRRLERHQQQLLQEAHERESRAEVPANAAGEAAQRQIEIDRERGAQAAAQRLERLEAERPAR
jgi:hypothetical protein